MLRNAFHKAAARGGKGRIAAGVCTLNTDDISSLWDGQRGLCYYSGIPMVLKTNTEWKCSVERLDPDEGYVPGNVVLCCQELNGRAQLSSQKMLMLLTPQIDVDLEAPFQKPERRVRPCLRLTKFTDEEGITWWTCRDCDERKDESCFHTQHDGTCKTCRAAAIQRASRTPWGHMKALLGGARGRTKERNKKGRQMQFDIDEQFIIDQYVKQRGKCYYSDINMGLGEDEDWRMSLERLNDDVGYVRHNVVLTCLEWNTAKGWTREKVNFLRQCLLAKIASDTVSFRTKKMCTGDGVRTPTSVTA